MGKEDYCPETGKLIDNILIVVLSVLYKNKDDTEQWDSW